MEAILATARLPRERDRRAMESREPSARRGMVDIALVLVLRDCGLRRSEAAARGWNRVLGGGCEPVTHVDGFLLFWHCCGISKVVSGSDGESWRFAGVVTLCTENRRVGARSLMRPWYLLRSGLLPAYQGS